MSKPLYNFKAKFNESRFSAETDHWKVELVDIGEGRCGEYNEEDPKDYPHMRFDVYCREFKSHPWQEPQDSSYCTLMNSDVVYADKRLRKRILMSLLSEFVWEPWDTHIKKRCEQLSWICETDEQFKPYSQRRTR